MTKYSISPRDFGLLNAIHCNPADDVVRLVYADWLEENGDPDDAEFIRLQCSHGRAVDVQWDIACKEDLDDDAPDYDRETILLERRVRKYAWTNNDKLYLHLTQFKRGLPYNVVFRTDDKDVLRWLEKATPSAFDRFESEVSPWLRFEL